MIIPYFNCTEWQNHFFSTLVIKILSVFNSCQVIKSKHASCGPRLRPPPCPISSVWTNSIKYKQPQTAHTRSTQLASSLTPASCSNSASNSNWDLLWLDELSDAHCQTCETNINQTTTHHTKHKNEYMRRTCLRQQCQVVLLAFFTDPQLGHHGIASPHSSTFHLDSGIPGRRVQPVIKPTHLTDGIIMTHQRVLPPAVRDGVEITEGGETCRSVWGHERVFEYRYILCMLYIHIVVPWRTHHSFTVRQHQTWWQCLKNSQVVSCLES